MSFSDLIEEKHGYIAEAYKQVYGEEQYEKIFIKSKKDLVLFIVSDKGFYKVLSDKELTEKNGRKDQLINMITANEFFSKEEERPRYMYTFHHSFFIITPNKPSNKTVEITGLGPKKNAYIITKLTVQRDINQIETVTVKEFLECKIIAQENGKTIVELPKILPLENMTQEKLGPEHIMWPEGKDELVGKGIDDVKQRRINLEKLKMKKKYIMEKLQAKVKTEKAQGILDKLKSKITGETDLYYPFLINSLLSKVPNGKILLPLLTGYGRLDWMILSEDRANERKSPRYLISSKIFNEWFNELKDGKYYKHISVKHPVSRFSFNPHSNELFAVVKLDINKPFSSILKTIMDSKQKYNIEIGEYLMSERRYTKEEVELYLTWLNIFKTSYMFSKISPFALSGISTGLSFAGVNDKKTEAGLNLLKTISNEMKGNDLQQEIDNISNKFSEVDREIAGKGMMNAMLGEDTSMGREIRKNIIKNLNKMTNEQEDAKQFLVEALCCI
jgi:hypothetical protein